MSVRVRKYIVMAVVVALAFAYSRVSSGWDDLAFFAGMAGLIATVGTLGNFWIEFAPDGAFRRKPRT
jgi:hypothetical protein